MEPPLRDPEPEQPLDLEIQPNPGAAKTIGTLNVIFGSLILLCGVGCAMQAAMQSAMGPMLEMQQQQIQVQMEAQRQIELKKLQDKENATEDPKEKAELQKQRKTIEATPMPKAPDMKKFVEAPGFRIYGLIDILSGLLMNLLMLISGVGVLALKEWGRKLALWTAGLKIIRLIGVYTYFIVAVVPLICRLVVEMFEEMAKSMPAGKGGPPPNDLNQMATLLGIVYSCMAVGMIVFGSIYPAIVLIVLNRRRVKAAFQMDSSAEDR